MVLELARRGGRRRRLARPRQVLAHHAACADAHAVDGAVLAGAVAPAGAAVPRRNAQLCGITVVRRIVAAARLRRRAARCAARPDRRAAGDRPGPAPARSCLLHPAGASCDRTLALMTGACAYRRPARCPGGCGYRSGSPYRNLPFPSVLHFADDLPIPYRADVAVAGRVALAGLRGRDHASLRAESPSAAGRGSGTSE